MPMNLADLDERTRKFMLEEVELDIVGGKLYLSEWFSERGKQIYPGLLSQAVTSGNDATLANGLHAPGVFVATYVKRKPSSGTTIARVPRTAPETFAEGEFNRFYIRGLCRRCLAEGISEVEIYRAKEVDNPRPDSEARIGKRIRCESLLNDLRTNIGVDTALGVPAGPNSGLSIRRAV